MVSSATKVRPGPRGGTRVLGNSRPSRSLGSRDFKIYTGSERVTKGGGGGGSGPEPSCVVPRSSIGKPPVAVRKSMPVAAKSTANTEANAKGAKKDAGRSEHSVNLKAGRRALADVSNLKSNGGYHLNSSQHGGAGLKKEKSEKTRLLHGKSLSTRVLRDPRSSLTKSTAVTNASSKKALEVKGNPRTVKQTASSIKELEARPNNFVSMPGKHIISETSCAKDIFGRQSSVGAKLVKHQDRKESSLIGKNSTQRLLLHRPSLTSRNTADGNVSSRKTVVAIRHSIQVKSKSKLAPVSADVNPSLDKDTKASTCSSSEDTAAVNSENSKLVPASSETSDGNITVIISRPKHKQRRSYTSSLMTGYKAIEERPHSSEMDKLPDIDNSANPLEVTEYVDDIYQYYWNMEVQNPLPENYMKNQKDITPRMRSVLINWLIEVHLRYTLMQETLFLMVELLDRTLSVIPIEKDDLQLVGLTVLFLASKYEDFWHPKVKELISVSANVYTKDQMLSMEKLILSKLRFRLNLPTPYVFMLRFLKASQSEKKLEHLSFYLIELCLVEYEALKFRPSLLCASAVYVARCTLQVVPAWSDLLKKHTRYDETEIRDCANMILRFQRTASTSRLKTTYKKFLEPDLSCAAAIQALDALPMY